MLKAVLKSILHRGYQTALRSGQPYASHPALVSGMATARVHYAARLTVENEGAVTPQILLGDGAFVADGVELVASAGGTVTIGADTSLQTACLIGGDVAIGSHCLFGRYVVVSSTTHRFRDTPYRLIRDQDRVIQLSPSNTSIPRSHRIVIEDDCWIGQGAVINPGVTIGRGAVIGANSVVTRDVPPYSIFGGVPAKAIGQRLAFAPPSALRAEEDEHLPYLYRGFQLAQVALEKSRSQGVVMATGTACLVLARGERIRLTGHSQSAQILTINGATHQVEGAFDLSVNASIPHTGILAGYSVVGIVMEKPWGLALAEIFS